jgi:2-hydroxy-6-oxonona-2,4-dienedioate hydrolase
MPPLTESRIDTAIGKVQVFRGGPPDAPTLVYLHSATGEGPGLPVLEELAGTFDVVVPMFPGFGESEGIEAINDIEDAVFHVLDVLEQLSLPRPAVMGLSLGGWMAAELAMRYPASVSHLILVNAAGLYIEGHPVKEIFGREPAELAEDLFADQSHPMAQMMHSVQALIDAKGEIPFEVMKPTLQSLAATAKVAWNPYLHDPKLRRLLYRVTAPTLVVHGAADRLIDRSHAEAYAEGIAGSRLVDVEGAGHLLALEKPDELAGLVRGFLTRAAT